MPIIPFAAGAVSKLFLRAACSDVKVTGLPEFLALLKGHGEREGRGLLTDEPFMWGVLPLSTFLDTKTVRWTLGASDMMYTGTLDSWFFNQGQVIETFRGKGIYQPALDEAIKKLDQDQWVHIFPEGRIKQEKLEELRRFKWGVSRMLMEAETTPLVIPILIQGFEQAMCESRTFPRFIPRPGKSITIAIGEPLNPIIEPMIEAYKKAFPTPWKPSNVIDGIAEDISDEPPELGQMRSSLAELMRLMLTQLGTRVMGEKR